MGMSTDAVLFYGYAPAWGDEEGTPWHSDTEEAANEEAADPYGLREAWEKEHGGEHLGVSVVEHCSGECLMFGLAITKSIVQAYRGSPKHIVQPAMLGDDWDKSLDEFIKAAGLKKKDLGKRGWWLASFWY